MTDAPTAADPKKPANAEQPQPTPPSFSRVGETVQMAEASDDSACDAGPAVEELKNQLAQTEERLLRAQADFENFRRRVRREQEDERRYAALPLIRDLLPVLDNLERALTTLSDDAVAGLRSGIEMVAQQFLAILQQHGCVPLNPDGASFDPHVHDAVGRQATSDVPAGTVVRVERVGYRLHDRIVRPAAVIVAVPPQPSENPSNEAKDR